MVFLRKTKKMKKEQGKKEQVFFHFLKIAIIPESFRAHYSL